MIARASGGCWPTETHEYLLRAALLDAGAGRDAWIAWRSRVGLEAIDPASLMLLPLVYRRLSPAGALGADEPRLRGIYRHSWARNQRRLRVAAKAIEILAGAGIETLALKGIVLGPRYYRDAGVRAMQDVDLAVRPTEVYRAVSALDRAGWRLKFPPFTRERRRSASTPLEDRHGQELDLHWHVLAVAPMPEADAAFWRDASVHQIDGQPARALDPAHELLHIVTHGLQWNPVHSLRWVADAVTLLRAEPQLDWERAIDLAARLGLIQPFRLGVGYVRDQFQAPVPREAWRRIASRRVTWPERAEWWARSQGQTLPAGPVSYAIWSWRQYRRMRHDGDGVTRPANFAQFVRDYFRMPSDGALATTLARETLERMK